MALYFIPTNARLRNRNEQQEQYSVSIEHRLATGNLTQSLSNKKHNTQK